MKDTQQKKKKDKKVIEAEIYAFLQSMMKKALDAALDDLFKDFH